MTVVAMMVLMTMQVVQGRAARRGLTEDQGGTIAMEPVEATIAVALTMTAAQAAMMKDNEATSVMAAQ
jgi:hypothetical protein